MTQRADFNFEHSFNESTQYHNAFGIGFYSVSPQQVAQRIMLGKPPKGMGVSLLVTANVDHIVRLSESQEFRKAYSRAFLITCDGAPLAAYVSLKGRRSISRATGADIFPEMMRELDPLNHRLFFLVSTDAVAERLASLLLEKLPRQNFRIHIPSFGFEKDHTGSLELAQHIREFAPSHVVMGVGAPKSEIWVDQYLGGAHDCFVCCFGAGIEFFVGEKLRAPSIMRWIGAEWVWRLIQEPRRLGRRYLLSAPKFAYLVWQDMTVGLHLDK